MVFTVEDIDKTLGYVMSGDTGEWGLGTTEPPTLSGSVVPINSLAYREALSVQIISPPNLPDLNICLGPNTCHQHHVESLYSILKSQVMFERMLYSYYVIKTRLVILLFVLAIILSARNIFPALVLVTCMLYFNLIINLLLCPALNSAFCIVFIDIYIISTGQQVSQGFSEKLLEKHKKYQIFFQIYEKVREIQHGTKTRLSRPPVSPSVPPP